MYNLRCTSWLAYFRSSSAWCVVRVVHLLRSTYRMDRRTAENLRSFSIALYGRNGQHNHRSTNSISFGHSIPNTKVNAFYIAAQWLIFVCSSFFPSFFFRYLFGPFFFFFFFSQQLWSFKRLMLKIFLRRNDRIECIYVLTGRCYKVLISFGFLLYFPAFRCIWSSSSSCSSNGFSYFKSG